MSNTEKYKKGWEKVYSSNSNPFEVEDPYQWVVDLEKQGKIQGNVLDSGCGAGHNSIFLASKGYPVVGVDISSKSIDRARQKAKQRGVSVEFAQANFAELAGYDHRFTTVIDIGCFHSLEEIDYLNYAASLLQACRTGAVLYLRAFSDLNTRRKGYTGQASARKISSQPFQKVGKLRSWNNEKSKSH
jgi:2-polyprenyl-3-methyl-5-hydroxy-6-metoxy-1,4-benzoquinol methylase